MLRLLVMLASIANCAGGLVLITTLATMWQHAADGPSAPAGQRAQLRLITKVAARRGPPARGLGA